MKNLQFNPYQQGAWWGRSKKSKPIPAPPCGARLKSHPIPAPLPLRGGETHMECSEEGCVKWDGAKLPTLLVVDD